MRTESTVSTFASLSVLEPENAGFIGGLLVLDRSGRPLEFHCTTPVRATRAQQILYGPTLRPYLFAEQIGDTLLSRMKASPEVLFVDQPEILELRETTTFPIVCVLPRGDALPPRDTASRDTASRDTASGDTVARLDLLEFTLGRNRLAVTTARRDDIAIVSESLREVAGWCDFSEPFQRIRDAVVEACRAA